MAAGQATGQTIEEQLNQAGQTFYKNPVYNRSNIETKAHVNARNQYKKEVFQNNEVVKDPYTGKQIYKNQATAKEQNGNIKQSGEVDHIVPLKNVHNQTKEKVWVTQDEVGDVANNEDNYWVVSTEYNRSKNDSTNKEVVKQEKVDLTEEGKKQALKDQKNAQKAIDKKLTKAKYKNIRETGHKAGKEGAKNAGVTAFATSAVFNFVDVIQGKKEVEDALLETATTATVATVSGYVVTGTMTVVAHSLTGGKSQILKTLGQANAPAKIITAISVTGKTLHDWSTGEITTQECILQLGEKGLSYATMGYSTAVGQALIPIPILGGVIGALIGTSMTSGLYSKLIQDLETKQLEREERMRIIAECKFLAQEERRFKAELEAYLEEYFRDYQHCFNEALTCIYDSFQSGDSEGVVKGANQITRKLGGTVNFETKSEFDVLMNSSVTFKL